MWERELDKYRLCIEVIRYIHSGNHASLNNYAKIRACQVHGNATPSGRVSHQDIDTERKFIRRTIDDVEAEFGVTLLTKQNDRLPANTRDKTLDFIRRLENFIWACERLTGGFRETVRISAIDAAINFWIPIALKSLLSGNDDAPHFQCNTREWWDVIEDVRYGHADFGFGTAMPCDALKQEVILDRPHVAVFSKSLKELSARNKLDVADFESYGLVCLHSFATPLGIHADLLHRGVRITRVDNCAQAIAWVRQGLGIALLTKDMVNDGSDLKTAPVAFSTIRARDALFSRKPRKRGTGKKERDSIDTPGAMVPAAQAAYDAILAYWRARSL